MSDMVLRLDNVTMQFGGVVAVNNLSLEVNRGEIVALIGPNGAGKSSLFRSILGQMPYEGSIKFMLAGGYPSRPKIGYVPQSPSFDRGYPISVLDFFAAAVSRWPVFLPVPKDLRERVGLNLLLNYYLYYLNLYQNLVYFVMLG